MKNTKKLLSLKRQNLIFAMYFANTKQDDAPDT
jgi:hypothetical protein